MRIGLKLIARLLTFIGDMAIMVVFGSSSPEIYIYVGELLLF